MPFFVPNEEAPIDFSKLKWPRDNGTGLFFVGANFHPLTLISAYRSGLFPWYIEHGFPFWFCPQPRMMLYPENVLISKSMKQVYKKNEFTYTCDTAFSVVMENCAKTKRHAASAETWIDENFIHAYTQLHEMGIAHSFETWYDKKLVGGLYGLAIGNVFFGESMFSAVTNASKAAFIRSVQFLKTHHFKIIDCQVPSAHLQSLGAITIDRSKFLKALQLNVNEIGLPNKSWVKLYAQFLIQ